MGQNVFKKSEKKNYRKNVSKDQAKKKSSLYVLNSFKNYGKKSLIKIRQENYFELYQLFIYNALCQND